MKRSHKMGLVQNLLIAILCVVSVNTVMADTLSGRMYLNHYISSDSSSAQDYQISTARLKLKAENFGIGNTAFNLDSRIKKKWGTRDYLKNNTPYRFNTLNLEFTKLKGKYDILVGRFSVPQVWTENMDGLSLNQRITDGVKVGLFGGFKSDPYSYDFNKDYSGAGGYLFLENKKGSMTLATMNDNYKGKTDRQHVDLNWNYGFFPAARIYSNLVLDYDKSASGFDITNFNLNVNARPLKTLRFNLGYSRFSAFKLQESMTFDLNRERQETLSLRINYSAPKGHFIYFNYKYSRRKVDDRNSSLYLIGLRKQNMFDTGLNFNCRYTNNDGFTWKRTSIFLEVSRNFLERLDMAMSYDQSDHTADLFDNKRKVKMYALSADLLITRKIFLFLNYELSKDEEWSTTTLFSGITYKF